MSKIIKLLKGSSLRTLSFTLQICLVFFLMPFIVKSLGDRFYGLWALVGSFTGYYFLLDFGISAAVSRFVAQAIGEDNKKKITELVSNSYVLFLLLGIISIIITALISFVIRKYVSPDLIDLVLILIWLVGVEFAVSLVFRVYSGVLDANLDFDLQAFIEMIKISLRALLIYLFLSNGFGIIALAAINFGVNIFALTANYYIVKKKYPYAEVKFNLVNRKIIIKLFSFSKYVFIAQIGDILRFKIDNFIIAIFFSLQSVTIYEIAARIISYFIQLSMTIFGVLKPLFSQYEGANDYHSLRRHFIFSVRLSIIVSLFIGFNLIIFGPFFIENWMGNSYSDSYELLFILVVGLMIALSQSVGVGILQSVNKHKFFAITNTIEAVSNLILTIFLVKIFGLSGVALGTAIPMIFIKAFVQPYVVCHSIELKKRLYIKQTLPPFISITIFYCIHYYIIHRFFLVEALSYLSMFIIIAGQAIIYLLFIYVLIFSKDEKRLVYGLFRRLTNQ